jgi:hypothetical protein
MSTQYISLQAGVEQSFQIDCGGVIYRFELFYDDSNLQWFMDVYNDETGVAVLLGLYLLVNNNALWGLEYMGIGTGLGLYDTQTDDVAIITKADLGVRVKLYREV